jgi:hypothetical protein
MKNFLSALTVIVLCTMTACKKDAASFATPSDNVVNANTVKISGNEAIVNLTKVEGFENPCFNILLDAALQGSFRFTGGYGYNTWKYQNLSAGLHTISFTCTHECDDDNEEGIMVFEINDGLSKQSISARETSHCKYEFGILVNN